MLSRLIYIEIPKTLGFKIPYNIKPVIQVLPIRTFIERYEIPSSAIPGFYNEEIINDVIESLSSQTRVNFEEANLFYQNVSENFWYEVDMIYDYSVEYFRFFRWQNRNGLLITG